MNPLRQASGRSSTARRGGSERLGNVPKDTQLVRGVLGGEPNKSDSRAHVLGHSI